MTSTGTNLTSSTGSVPPPRRRRWPLVVGVLVGAPVIAAAALAALFVLAHVLNNRPVPHFASLAAAPDTSLHGTVAYYDSSSRCVRLVAASGATSKDLLCLGNPVLDPANKRKEIGPQLAWKADGRVEITMFWMTGRPGWVPSWQKLVDPRTGAVADVPAAQLPAQPTAAARATVSPTGERVAFTSDGGNGKVRITLTDASGTSRTLLSAQGPGEYTYGLDSAFWSPTWQWVAASDGRILVVTTGPQPVTRVLVDDVRDDSEMPGFAVTAADLLG